MKAKKRITTKLHQVPQSKRKSKRYFVVFIFPYIELLRPTRLIGYSKQALLATANKPYWLQQTSLVGYSKLVGRK
jgi:hypothetical protein